MEKGEVLFNENDMREPPKGLFNILKNIGPGIVVSGSVIGSGELLVTTRVGAQFGYYFLWGVLVCCLIKYFIQIELGRFSISENTTSLQAINRLPLPKIRNTSWLNIFFYAILVMITPALAGILGSTAGLLYSIMPFLPAKIWGVILFLVVMIILWRGYYNDIEKVVMGLVASFSFVVIFCFFLIQGSKYAVSGGQVLSGLTFQVPQGAWYIAMALMGSVGLTAGEMWMYPYWVLEKGYPKFVGRKQGESKADWAERCKGWVNVMRADALVCTLLATVITVAYYFLGAAILHYGLGIVPSGMEVVKELSAIFTESFGPWAYALFMFGAFCTLFSTLYVVAASQGRIWTDFLDSLGLVNVSTDAGRLKWHRIMQTFWPALWLIFFLGIPKPMTILLFGLFFNGLWLPFLAVAVIFLARKTKKEIMMSPATAVALYSSTVVIVVYTIVQLALKK